MLRYAITDRMRLAASEARRRDALLEQARRCARAGVDFLQLREKDLAARDLADLGHGIVEVLRGESAGTRLLINSRADVAVAIQAAGVHLTSGRGELTPDQVRRVYAAAGLGEPVVSLSCHTVAEVVRARELRASLVLFGPVFEKVVLDVNGEEPQAVGGGGLELLRTACVAAGPMPVLALGGVTEVNLAECLQAGAAGVAGIRLFR